VTAPGLIQERASPDRSRAIPVSGEGAPERLAGMAAGEVRVDTTRQLDDTGADLERAEPEGSKLHVGDAEARLCDEADPQLRGSITTPPAARPDSTSESALSASERLYTPATGIVNPSWANLAASCSRMIPFGLTITLLTRI
jgi:hypothetical protein